MSQNSRIIIAVVILVLLIGIVLGVDAFRRAQSTAPTVAGEPTLVPGGIPIYVNGKLVGSFTPADLEQLEEVSFVDAEDGKTQEGWMLRDVLMLHVDKKQLTDESTITVISYSRNKSARLSWAEVNDAKNMVMFDLSGRGTLKLVSLLEKLDVRDEWVQDVEKIEIVR